MIIKKRVLKKVLPGGMVAEFCVVKNEGEYQAALFINDKYVGGPTMPQPLHPPKGDVTYWMGNKPSVGLTTHQAEEIMELVEKEAAMERAKQKSGWD